MEEGLDLLGEGKGGFHKLRTGGFIYNLDEQSQYPIKYMVCGKRLKTYWCDVCNNVFKLCC